MMAKGTKFMIPEQYKEEGAYGLVRLVVVGSESHVDKASPGVCCGARSIDALAHRPGAALAQQAAPAVMLPSSRCTRAWLCGDAVCTYLHVPAWLRTNVACCGGVRAAEVDAVCQRKATELEQFRKEQTLAAEAAKKKALMAKAQQQEAAAAVKASGGGKTPKASAAAANGPPTPPRQPTVAGAS